MNLLSPIARGYKRWRHSRGYGVHSPFAYSLVNMAISPGHPYGYYGYFDIDSALTTHADESYPRLRHDARLLLRTMATLGSRRLVLASRCKGVFHAVAKALAIPCQDIRPDRMPHTSPSDFFLICNFPVSDKAIREMLQSGTAVMAINPAPNVKSALISYETNGVLMTGRRIIMVIPNPDMAFVAYDMKF